jgi:ubiquitin-protein ligase
MSNPAAKRLFKEYKSLSSDPPEGITAGPVTEDDMFLWEALIQGPEGTPFEGGVFPAELKFPKDYPLAPPKMKFLTDMWHPNGICNTHMREDMGKETAADRPSVRQRRSMHIDSTPTRRRPSPVRASF